MLYELDRRVNKSERTKRGVSFKIDQDTVKKIIQALKKYYNRRV